MSLLEDLETEESIQTLVHSTIWRWTHQVMSKLQTVWLKLRKILMRLSKRDTNNFKLHCHWLRTRSKCRPQLCKLIDQLIRWPRPSLTLFKIQCEIYKLELNINESNVRIMNWNKISKSLFSENNNNFEHDERQNGDKTTTDIHMMQRNKIVEPHSNISVL